MSNGEKNNELKPQPLSSIIDYIAVSYILTADFESLKKLTEIEHCNDLIILTSDIISKYLSNLDINYLSQRIKEGKEVNIMDNTNVIIFKKSDIPNFEMSPIKKKRLCLGIAKFYIKIAHVFSAIVMAINPTYKFKNSEGNTEIVNLFNKNKIPINAPRTINKINICNNRIDALTGNDKYYIDASNNMIKVNPVFCDFNDNKNGDVKSLLDETGIKQLEELYYDKYDYVEGKFIGMTPKTEEIYNNDLKNFYKVFTGETEMPEYIKSFKDIKLNDYKKFKNCQGKEALFRKPIVGDLKNSLFAKYAQHIKTMIETTNKNQEELLEIINNIFVYSTNPITKTRQVRINPKLTDVLLQDIVNKTRNILIKLYLTCENDYKVGIKLYQQIIENKIREITQKQIENLNKNIENIDLSEVQPSELPLKSV